MATYKYDPYGNLVSSEPAANSIGAINPIRYRGYYYDTDSQLYYLQSRYYDPELGRFLNADAFASTGQGTLGYNMFAYCGNNPINYTDANGKFAETAIIAGLISGAIRAISTLVTSGDVGEAAVEFAVGFIDGAFSSSYVAVGVLVFLYDTIKLIKEFKKSGATDAEVFAAILASLSPNWIPTGTGDEIADLFVELTFGFGNTLVVDGSLEAWRRNIENEQIVFSPSNTWQASSIKHTGRNGGVGGYNVVLYVGLHA